jgi:hypothetical protein
VKEGSFKNLFKDDNLKKSAKDKLENCRKEDITLYEFLKNFSLNLEDEMKNRPELKNLCDEIAYKPEERI